MPVWGIPLLQDPNQEHLPSVETPMRGLHQHDTTSRSCLLPHRRMMFTSCYPQRISTGACVLQSLNSTISYNTALQLLKLLFLPLPLLLILLITIPVTIANTITITVTSTITMTMTTTMTIIMAMAMTMTNAVPTTITLINYTIL